MQIHIYTYIIYTNTYAYTYTYTYTYTHIHMHTYTHTHAHIYVHIIYNIFNTTARKDEDLFMVKIQIPAAGVTSRTMKQGMMVYDKNRKFQAFVRDNNCVESEWKKLGSVIKRSNIAGGMKGYFNAFISEGSLKIIVSDPKPNQSW